MCRSLPQTLTPNFEIGADEMGIGMGIHGEPGIARIPVEKADAVADRLMEPILAELSLAAGDSVAVMVNGLGSTSMMELYILHRRVRLALEGRNVSMHANFVGNYATSMEMAGYARCRLEQATITASTSAAVLPACRNAS